MLRPRGVSTQTALAAHVATILVAEVRQTHLTSIDLRADCPLPEVPSRRGAQYGAWRRVRGKSQTRRAAGLTRERQGNEVGSKPPKAAGRSRWELKQKLGAPEGCSQSQSAADTTFRGETLL